MKGNLPFRFKSRRIDSVHSWGLLSGSCLDWHDALLKTCQFVLGMSVFFQQCKQKTSQTPSIQDRPVVHDPYRSFNHLLLKYLCSFDSVDGKHRELRLNINIRKDFTTVTCALSWAYWALMFSSKSGAPKRIKIYVHAFLCTNVLCSRSAHTVVHLKVLKYLYRKFGHVNCAKDMYGNYDYGTYLDHNAQRFYYTISLQFKNLFLVPTDKSTVKSYHPRNVITQTDEMSQMMHSGSSLLVFV